MDPFAILRQGTKFNKERFASDIKSFKNDAKPKLAQSVATNLDFFAVKKEESPSETKSEERKRKRTSKKKTASDDDEDEEDDEEEEILEGHQDEVDAQELFGKHQISVEGNDVPGAIGSWSDLVGLGVPQIIIENIRKSSYLAPTPIQMNTIPILLGGREVLGCAPTGSGKTLAYAVPLLASLRRPMNVGFRACIVSPTRELAQQIKRECERLGAGMNLKIKILDKSNPARRHAFLKQNSMKLDVIISTPLRLVQMIREGLVKLDRVEWLLLDEADTLLDQAFDDQLDEIVAACTLPERKIALFSATMPERVERIARSVLHDPIRVIVGKRNAAQQLVKQQLIFVGREDGKLMAVRQLVQKGLKPPVLVFVQSKARAIELFHELVYDGINVDVIHADRTKLQRDSIVKSFRLGKIWVMIATDLMARGLDFKGVNMVINYDFPPSAIEYVHRIGLGRTGRAGREGEAVTFWTEDDRPNLRPIAGVMRASGCDVPDWMMKLSKKTKSSQIKVIPRETITTSLQEKQKLKRLAKEEKQKLETQEAAEE